MYLNTWTPGRPVLNLLLCEPEEIESDNTAVIKGDRAEHLRKILKASPGDSVSAGIIGTGRGSAEILELKPGMCRIRIQKEEEPDTLYPLRLAVGMVRPIQVKRILKTGASFGISEFLFLPTALGEASYRKANIWDDYRRLLVEGASQGGVCTLPKVSLYGSLQELTTAVQPEERCIVYDLPYLSHLPGGDSPRKKGGVLSKEDKALILIGSERGWTDKERKEIYTSGFECRSLGSRILTTETACTAAIVLTLQEMGFF